MPESDAAECYCDVLPHEDWMASFSICSLSSSFARIMMLVFSKATGRMQQKCCADSVSSSLIKSTVLRMLFPPKLQSRFIEFRQRLPADRATFGRQTISNRMRICDPLQSRTDRCTVR